MERDLPGSESQSFLALQKKSRLGATCGKKDYKVMESKSNSVRSILLERSFPTPSLKADQKNKLSV